MMVLVLSVMSAGAQRFFNLTAGEVSIDSVLPRFTYSVPLDEHYADSLYFVTIDYPEYVEMNNSDVARYHAVTSEELPPWPEISTQLVVSRKKGALEVSFVPLVKQSGKYRIMASFMLRVDSRAKKPSLRASSRASEAASRYADHSVLAEGRWAKISVASSGVYQLTPEVVKKAGFSDFNRVKIYGYGGALQNEALDGEALQALDDLKEIPTCTVNGRRLFYGQGSVTWQSPATMRRTRNPYSDYGYYFITESDGEPLSVDSAEFVSSFYPVPADYHVLHEVDNYALFYGGRNLFENTPIALGASKEYTVGRAGRRSDGKIAVCVAGGTASSVQIEVNDSVVGTLSFSLKDTDEGNQAIGTFDIPDLKDQNVVRLTTKSGGPVRLDYIDVYTPDMRDAPALSSSKPAAEYVYNITNQDLHADGPADMVIIIPTSQQLRVQAQRLADFHVSHDSLRVRIVPADELFNEFGSGTPDANAYRRYLKMLYDRAETEADMPRYLMLFGDCLWDNRMLTPECRNFSADDFLLCYESENSFSHVDCYVDDGFFCLLDDGEGTSPQYRDKLDVAVGRFPVRYEVEAKVMVDKTIAYAENDNAGSWQNVVMFLGDDGDNNTHMIDVNAVADNIETTYPGYHVKRVMWDAYKMSTSSVGNSYPEVSKAIKQQQAEGALIIDYGGHGSEISISHERVLKLSDFQQFNNKNLPLWVTASCDIMPFDGPVTNIGEECVLNSKGGAMAFFGTTRKVWTNYNKVINRAFIRNVLSTVDGKPLSIGEAARVTKNYLITSGEDTSNNKLQYSLLGDPALTLHLPTQTVVIDSINGKKVEDGYMPVLGAGSVVRVAGHVENADGLTDEAFNGLVSATVRDTRELIVCKVNNKNETSTPFTFYDRQKILFNGSDSIHAGKFAFTFAVPMDINYAEGTGLINLHAVNKQHDKTAHGAYDRFYVYGSAEIVSDGIGPSIYCYLNSPSFTDGSNVNATPYFVAKVNDKDGINASGAGIGHDMELIIDGQMARTYNLNDNFTFDFGNYTSGTTFYSIPELEPGRHQLLFRVWDILNNSSTAQLSFNVVKGLQPTLFGVSCTENPARTTTTFIVNHDRTGSAMDVEIEIFDMSGRLLWQHAETGVSTGDTYTVDWDLTVDGGRRLQTGVYLYRVLVSTDGSTQASKAKKLIIVGNN